MRKVYFLKKKKKMKLFRETWSIRVESYENTEKLMAERK